MQQLTTVYQKYVTKNSQSVNPPLSKLWEIPFPTPLRIDVLADRGAEYAFIGLRNTIDAAMHKYLFASFANSENDDLFISKYYRKVGYRDLGGSSTVKFLVSRYTVGTVSTAR